MLIGKKIYYELLTGDVILITPEKVGGINTTKEQDFAMYDVLAVRNPEQVGVIQLEYGQYRRDFELCGNNVRVDLETGELLFSYPVFEQPLSVKLEQLEAENSVIKQENIDIKLALAELAQTQEMDKIEIQLALAELGGLVGGDK
jgi:hypothetical protein